MMSLAMISLLAGGYALLYGLIYWCGRIIDDGEGDEG